MPRGFVDMNAGPVLPPQAARKPRPLWSYRRCSSARRRLSSPHAQPTCLRRSPPVPQPRHSAGRPPLKGCWDTFTIS